MFVPVAVETLGPICSVGEEFVNELGRRIANVSGDPRDTAFLFQGISIAVQRGNAAAVLVPELSTGRMDPRVGSGRVGPGRVGSRFCRILPGRVGSGQRFIIFY